MNASVRLARHCLLAMLILMQGLAIAEDNVTKGNSVNSGHVLRVCADPNNMPFSNHSEQGFENKLAKILGKSLQKQVEYTWWAQRRGFIRATLNANQCDVVMGLPSEDNMVLTTMPYYRSSYVLMYRADRKYAIHTLDDPQLKKLRIGVHLIGNNSPPPAIALAHRGNINNVIGYNIYGDYRQPNPPLQLIKAVVNGDIDAAIVWGPLAGYFAKHVAIDLTIVPLVNTAHDGLPFAFSIAVGVRKGDEAMKTQLDAALQRNQAAIHALLDEYNVPQVAIGEHPINVSFRD